MKIDIKDIDTNVKYQGYIWISDQPKPEVLDNSLINPEFLNVSNPFIIEAQLYDKDNGWSYSVSYVDGKQIACKYKVIPEDSLANEIKYVAHRIKDYNRLKFVQVWKEEKDDLCLGMKTKVPAQRMFIGFTNKNEEEE